MHGRLDLLAALHRKIGADIERHRPSDWRIVHLGDYVDRGPDSKGVLDFLADAKARDERVLALAGNHDVAFLEFLQDAKADGLFRHYGGIDTARSYGVEFAPEDEAAFRESHDRLVAAMPARHLEFLLSLPFSAAFGDFFFCHAGIRPGVPLERQSAEDLLWIRAGFLDAPDLHPKVVVHGHTPVEAPEVRAGRINVDTGAFRTGVLTAVVIDGASTRFMSVQL